MTPLQTKTKPVQHTNMWKVIKTMFSIQADLKMYLMNKQIASVDMHIQPICMCRFQIINHLKC